jgi:hypothetical protein
VPSSKHRPHPHGLVRAKHRRISLDAHDDVLGAVALARLADADGDAAVALQQAGECVMRDRTCQCRICAREQDVAWDQLLLIVILKAA